jgi:hypothetical protein
MQVFWPQPRTAISGLKYRELPPAAKADFSIHNRKIMLWPEFGRMARENLLDMPDGEANN